MRKVIYYATSVRESLPKSQLSPANWFGAGLEILTPAAYPPFTRRPPLLMSDVDIPQHQGSPRQGNGELILFVDDEGPVRKMAGTALKRSGYTVLLADNGIDALTSYRLQQKAIEVVITDVVMPIMDGVALCRALKDINPGVKIIASTGRRDSLRDSLLSAQGVKGFLEKPYSIANLLSMIHSILRESTEAGCAIVGNR